MALKRNGRVNTVATGLIVSGLMMLVSVMSSANPKITPLMPVLSSPLLGLHVAIIMVAYALLAFMLINGLAAVIVRICNKDSQLEIERMAEVSRGMLFPAVMCLAFGIIIGSVWANISWGNYWAWDPKETWSLITLMIYRIKHTLTFSPIKLIQFMTSFLNIMSLLKKARCMVSMPFWKTNSAYAGMRRIDEVEVVVPTSGNDAGTNKFRKAFVDRYLAVVLGVCHALFQVKDDHVVTWPHTSHDIPKYTDSCRCKVKEGLELREVEFGKLSLVNLYLAHEGGLTHDFTTIWVNHRQNGFFVASCGVFPLMNNLLVDFLNGLLQERVFLIQREVRQLHYCILFSHKSQTFSSLNSMQR